MSIIDIKTELHSKESAAVISDRNSDFITAETLRKLLQKLDRFEKSGLYLKGNISLCKLSAYCGSNSKYVSRVINSCKNRDYNNYINELRVQYIVKKLQTDRRYRRYKIAVLAKEAGFSSPGKFSTIFKNSKGILPSAYIKNLK